MYAPDQKTLEELQTKYPEGSRIMCLSMDDPYSAIEEGTRGTVSYIDDMGTIHVNWDNGRHLGLVLEDNYRPLTKEELDEETSQELTM